MATKRLFLMALAAALVAVQAARGEEGRGEWQRGGAKLQQGEMRGRQEAGRAGSDTKSYTVRRTRWRSGRKLPAHISACYADWQECDSKVLTAAKQGCNVIMWFSINIRRNFTSGEPMILGGPDPNCVAMIASELEAKKMKTLHMISVGGWDQPHPDTSNSAEKVWAVWKKWNEEEVARPQIGFAGYDGIDWDVEGSDTEESPSNVMTVEVMDLMGKVSQLAKKDGYLASLSAMESYLDPSTSAYNRSLLQSYNEWEGLEPGFRFHGRNTLAYVLEVYGESEVTGRRKEGELERREQAMAKKKILTFDWISIQLYESYSHANFAIYQKKSDPAKYFTELMNAFVDGWTVDFSSDRQLSWMGKRKICLNKSQVVLGLANAWAGVGRPIRTLFLTAGQIKKAYAAMEAKALAPRGLMFWSIKFEGQVPVNDSEPLYLASVFDDILHTRDASHAGIFGFINLLLILIVCIVAATFAYVFLSPSACRRPDAGVTQAPLLEESES